MIHIFDGAMGTMLQQAGMPSGYCPEAYNLENPTAITAIHQAYLAAGSTIIETNTFGANRLKLSHYNLQNDVEKINKTAAYLARQAAGTQAKVAGSVGPTGKLIAPLGDLDFEEAYQAFVEQIRALDEGGVDYILIETIIDIQEMRAALLAAKAASTKPVICQLTFGPDGRTVTGTTPAAAANLLEAMGASVIGANCSLGPQQLIPIIQELRDNTTLPISAQPNAGMPELHNGETVFPLNPDAMATYVPALIAAGATYLGGCCGTTPKHISTMKTAALACPEPKTQRKSADISLILTSRSKVVRLSPKLPPALIGERINPTGRKLLQQDIKTGSYIAVKKEALLQVRAGADILDINMGVPGINQAAVMKEAVEQLSMLVDVPFSIDTTDAEALEAGLRAYPGRALINSVTAEPERIRDFLPLAKKYGAAILCLPISPSGVPKTAAERLNIVKQIIHAASACGLKEKDLLLDALILTAAAEPTAGQEALNTIRLYRKHYRTSITGGLSNISYGLPERDLVNSAFCAMALSAGLNAPIINPYNARMAETIAASSVLLGHDVGGQNYSKNYTQSSAKNETMSTADQPILLQIKNAVINGEVEGVTSLVREALEQKNTPLTITDEALTAAMNDVGDAFGAGRCFLPQVLLSAETMRAAFQTMKNLMPNQTQLSLGTVILATVKGDIHDLGKNIVAALLENNGFTIIDLGKDVPAEKIVEATKKFKANIVGLCALMTTTMPQIAVTIDALRKAQLPVKIIIGGAVVTPEYAQEVGADNYAGDGVAAVRYAKTVSIQGE
jgi:5-methyltetrahydrofolate--homocysteine methyltransferase